MLGISEEYFGDIRKYLENRIERFDSLASRLDTISDASDDEKMKSSYLVHSAIMEWFAEVYMFLKRSYNFNEINSRSIDKLVDMMGELSSQDAATIDELAKLKKEIERYKPVLENGIKQLGKLDPLVIWICECGRINPGSANFCSNCGESKS